MESELSDAIEDRHDWRFGLCDDCGEVTKVVDGECVECGSAASL